MIRTLAAVVLQLHTHALLTPKVHLAGLHKVGRLKYFAPACYLQG